MQQLKCMALIFGLIIFGMLIVILLQQAQLPRFACFDVKMLISKEAQKLAHNNLPPKELQLIAANIKTKVASYAKKHRLTLFTKGAIWGPECLDHTAKIIEFMEQPNVN